MGDEQELIGAIYEAGALPQCWPALLERLSERFGTVGALLFAQGSGGVRWVGSPSAEPIMAEWVAEGYADDNVRTEPLLRKLHPGFSIDLDHHEADALAALPAYRDFLTPRGLATGAATLIQGAGDDAIIISLEGFAAPAAAREAVIALDRLRPHLARAATLSARLRLERDRAAVDGLTTIGTAGAVLDRRGRLSVANAAFEARLAPCAVDRAPRLALRERTADAALAAALDAIAAGAGGRSIAVRGADDRPPFALHLLPLKGAARDVFERDGMLAVVAEGHNQGLPGADLLRALFDLTPAEARLARALLDQLSLGEAARRQGVQVATARTQLKSVFAKTGVTRQAELVALLAGFAAPAA